MRISRRGIFKKLPLFPSSSQRVLKFPTSSQMHLTQYVLNSTWVLWSHMVCPEFNSHECKLKRRNLGEHICFYFATRVQSKETKKPLMGTTITFVSILQLGSKAKRPKKKFNKNHLGEPSHSPKRCFWKKLWAHPWWD